MEIHLDKPDRNAADRPRVASHTEQRGGFRTRTESALALQRSVGNRTTVRYLQRVSADGTITDPVEMARDRPVGGPVDVETRVRPFDVLVQSPRSKAVIDAIVKLRGDLNFPIVWSAKGNFFDGTGITLDRTKNEAIWTASLAHEIVHLHASLAGTSGKLATMGREEYVNTQMTEEIGAHAIAYVTQLQLKAATSSSAGYNEFVGLLKTKHAKLLKDQDWAAIEELAKKFVEGKYKTTWTGSATGKNYWDKFRAAWDAAHPGSPDAGR